MTGEPVRTQVANRIRQDNPKLDVRDWGYVPDNVSGKSLVVAVYMAEMSPASSAALIRQDLTVNVYGSKTTNRSVEDELDGVRDQVMLSLQRLDSWTWTRASRTVWKETITGWQITGYVEFPNPYAQTVRAERNAQ